MLYLQTKTVRILIDKNNDENTKALEEYLETKENEISDEYNDDEDLENLLETVNSNDEGMPDNLSTKIKEKAVRLKFSQDSILPHSQNSLLENQEKTLEGDGEIFAPQQRFSNAYSQLLFQEKSFQSSNSN